MTGSTLNGHPEPGDIRHRFPRFDGDNARRNAELVARLRTIAEGRGVSVAQLAIAWVRSRGEDIVPLIGARRRDQLAEALAGLEIELSEDELAAIEAAVPEGSIAGTRYGAAQMADLDSER